MRATLLVLAAAFPILAQEPTPAAPPSPAPPPLPAVESPEATALVDQGIAKMLAFGRGTFRTSEKHDVAMMRGQDWGNASQQVEVEGGWQQGFVWAEADGQSFLRNAGRLLVRKGDKWKLRGKKLANGAGAPFTVDPMLLFTVLRDLPADARRVVHVEAGEVGGRKVAILSLTLASDVGTEFTDCGVLPEVSGGMDSVFIIAGLGGARMPESDCDVHLALSIDADSGDVLRFGAKVYERGGHFGGVQIQVGGGGEEEKEEEPEAKPGEPVPEWKHGLPTRKPERSESVLVYEIEFDKLGLAKPPELDDKAKELLSWR